MGKPPVTWGIHPHFLELLHALGIVRTWSLTRAGCGPASIAFPLIREGFLQALGRCQLHPALLAAAFSTVTRKWPLLQAVPGGHRHPPDWKTRVSLPTPHPPLPEPAPPAPLRAPNMGWAHPGSPAQARTGAWRRGVTQGPGSSPGPGERPQHPSAGKPIPARAGPAGSASQAARFPSSSRLGPRITLFSPFSGHWGCSWVLHRDVAPATAPQMSGGYRSGTVDGAAQDASDPPSHSHAIHCIPAPEKSLEMPNFHA